MPWSKPIGCLASFLAAFDWPPFPLWSPLARQSQSLPLSTFSPSFLPDLSGFTRLRLGFPPPSCLTALERLATAFRGLDLTMYPQAFRNTFVLPSELLTGSIVAPCFGPSAFLHTLRTFDAIFEMRLTLLSFRGLFLLFFFFFQK